MNTSTTDKFERRRLDSIAKGMGCAPESTPTQRAALDEIELYAAGYGSIARPMSERLLDFGLGRYVLVDPKRYRKRSVASQCEPAEVGRLKVEVGAEWLGRRGARVKAFAWDLCNCPDGLVSENAIVVASLDNRRADIAANRLAARMRCRLVKVNIEPRYAFISVRCYDFRGHVEVCCECQLSERAYQDQTHPKSCDGPAGRRTAAPRWLSQAAGDVAALVVAQLADERTAAEWYGRQWQLALDSGQPQWSGLTPSPHCRWEHGRHWPNLCRLRSQPQEISLDRLLRLADADAGTATRLRFCQQVATRVSCERCGALVDSVRWLSEVDQPVGECECGGQMLPMPYWTYRQLRASQLAAVLGQPLAAWGVQPYAVIEIARDERRQSFVMGDGAPPGAAGSSNANI